MKLFLRKTNCAKSDKIRDLMLDPLWQIVEVVYITSTEPFLQVSEAHTITDPEQIVEYLIKDSNTPPSVVEQFRNAKKAAVATYKNVIKTGQIRAPEELIAARLEICNTCPYNQIKWFVQRCNKCGCSIRGKTASIVESCPIGKW